VTVGLDDFYVNHFVDIFVEYSFSHLIPARIAQIAGSRKTAQSG
jgi:hypothetical protein